MDTKSILVGAGDNVYLDELSRLAQTLGISVSGKVYQARRDGAGYLGKGKRQELRQVANDAGAEFAITDDELTSSQTRILEKDSGTTVVDRTELIIKIFESHAMDSASRMEVELADLEYRLPRIKGKNPAFSRLGGGVGGGRITRGPGEQQLEYDRRAIRNRIKFINSKLVQEKKSRSTRRSKLNESSDFTVALVGYTNAGKTTILNAISGAGRTTADRLFETLETTTRRVKVNNKSSSSLEFVVTDTVGFIRKLPTQLVHSFASTLEVASEHDLRVVCADASSPDLSEEIETVQASLGRSGSMDLVLCLNKTDLLDEPTLKELKRSYPEALFISALDNKPAELIDAIAERMTKKRERIQLLLPHDRYKEVNLIYEKSEIHSREDLNTGVYLDITLPKHLIDRYLEYVITQHDKPISFR